MTGLPALPGPVAGGPAPVDAATVVSPDWLTAALRTRHPGVTVTDTHVTERIDTFATKVRFGVSYAAGADGLPTAICAKGYFKVASRDHMVGAQTEAVFYRDIAPTLDGITMPTCLYAAVDEATGHGLVLMEDLVAGGATFPDPRTSWGPEQAAVTLGQLAALHAAQWGRPEADRSPAFPPRLSRFAASFDQAWLQGQLDDGRASDLPADVRRADRVVAALLALEALGADRPQCLLHGDAHPGNVYDRDGRAGFLDWQIAQWGGWALDVAYHVASVLDPDDRAEAERDLLDHYLDRLAAHGVVPPGRDDAWWLYRTHLPYGFFLWGITRLVERPIIDHRIRCLGLAMAEHRSLDLLGV